MADFIVNNAGTILVGAVLLVILGFVISQVIKDRKTGKLSCGGCAGCAMQGRCHNQKNHSRSRIM